MSADPDCIFCKIIAGEIPSFKIFEDDKTFAFMDINPVNPGHALVIPKHHAADVYETPGEWIAVTAVTAARVARAVKEVIAPYGLNLVQANGPGAQQSVMHFHVHVVPRSKDDKLTMNWVLNPGDKDEIAVLAEKIAANLAEEDPGTSPGRGR